MASTTPKPVKQLGQLLQEQQEPFILEAYLLERGYLKKSRSLNSNDSFESCQANSSKFLKRSASCGKNKSTKGIPLCSKILRAVFKKLVSNPKVKHSVHGDGKFSVTDMGRNSHEVAEPDRFSSATSTTVFNSCSESDIEETCASSRKDDISSTADTFQACNLREKEVATDRKLQWRTKENSKQFSPVSVLEEVPSEEGSPIHNNKTLPHSRTRQEETTSTENFNLCKKLTEDSILSACLWELLLRSPAEMPSCTGVADLQEHLKSKRALQQNKQLLFDCIKEVKEVVETHGEKEKKQQQSREELGKIICENTREYGDETYITQLLHLDLLASVEEWSEFKAETRKIAIKIGVAIWEEMSNEIITDILGTK